MGELFPTSLHQIRTPAFALIVVVLALLAIGTPSLDTDPSEQVGTSGYCVTPEGTGLFNVDICCPDTTPYLLGESFSCMARSPDAMISGLPPVSFEFVRIEDERTSELGARSVKLTWQIEQAMIPPEGSFAIYRGQTDYADDRFEPRWVLAALVSRTAAALAEAAPRSGATVPVWTAAGGEGVSPAVIEEDGAVLILQYRDSMFDYPSPSSSGFGVNVEDTPASFAYKIALTSGGTVLSESPIVYLDAVSGAVSSSGSFSGDSGSTDTSGSSGSTSASDESSGSSSDSAGSSGSSGNLMTSSSSGQTSGSSGTTSSSAE